MKRNFYNKLEKIIHKIIIDKSEMDTKQLNPREYQGLIVNISDELIEQTAEKCYEFLIVDSDLLNKSYEYVIRDKLSQGISLDEKMNNNIRNNIIYIIDKDKCISLFNDIIYNLVGDGDINLEDERNIYNKCKNYNTLGNEYIKDFIIDSIETYINDIIDRNDVLPNFEGLNDVQINILQDKLADFLSELFHEQNNNKEKHGELFKSQCYNRGPEEKKRKRNLQQESLEFQSLNKAQRLDKVSRYRYQ